MRQYPKKLFKKNDCTLYVYEGIAVPTFNYFWIRTFYIQVWNRTCSCVCSFCDTLDISLQRWRSLLLIVIGLVQKRFGQYIWTPDNFYCCGFLKPPSSSFWPVPTLLSLSLLKYHDISCSSINMSVRFLNWAIK